MMNNKKLAIVILLGAMFVISIFLLVLSVVYASKLGDQKRQGERREAVLDEKNNEEDVIIENGGESKEIDKKVSSSPFDDYFSRYITEDLGLNIEGTVLYVAQGNLWRADMNGSDKIKLIDTGNILGAAFSPDKQRIAYVVMVSKKEVVTEYDGSEKEVEVFDRNLMLADSRGSNSILIKEGVESWGWMDSESLWYETSSLKLIFNWEYVGNDDVWIFNVVNKKADEVVDESIDKSTFWQRFFTTWSPNKQKLMFVAASEENDNTGLVLKVEDKQTHEIKELFDVPYVGGDRGGPPPLPNFYWSQDSKFIYTTFSPLIYGEDNSPYKSGYLYIFKIPIDGSEIIELMPPVPSLGNNNELYSTVMFREDFMELVYLRFRVEDIENLQPDDWVYQGDIHEKIPIVLAKYDVEKQQEEVVLENIKDLLEGGKFRYLKTGLSFYPSNIVPFLVKYNKFTEDYLPSGSGGVSHIDFIKLVKINLSTNEIEQTFKFPSHEYLLMENIQYLPEEYTLIFVGQCPERDKALYAIFGDKMGIIVDNFTSIKFYFDESEG